MNLFFKSLDQLSHADIAEFCEQGLPESVRIEYKRRLSTKNPELQVAKCVSALANTQGGIVLFGVGTRENSRYPDWPSDGMPVDSDFEKKVTRWCIEHIYPPVVPIVGYAPNPLKSSAAFAVIRVEPSALGPHTTEGGTTIYIRRGDNSDPVKATFSEIELLRNYRQRELELEERHLDDLRRRIGLSPPPSQRSSFLLISQVYGREDAIPHPELKGIAETIRENVFQNMGELTSYSKGLFSAVNRGWTFALTGRGSLGVAFNHAQAGAPPGEKLNIAALTSWAGVAVYAARLLAVKSDFWGDLRIQYEAYGHAGVLVAGLHWEQACVDPAIQIEIKANSLVLREKKFEPIYELLWPMLWSFGLGTVMPSRSALEEQIGSYLKNAGV